MQVEEHRKDTLLGAVLLRMIPVDVVNPESEAHLLKGEPRGHDQGVSELA